MESFISLALSRRSMRKFTDEAVPQEAIDALMRSALLAPSGKGLHSYEFLTVTDKSVIETLSRCRTQGSAFLAEAPLAVVVMGSPAVSDTWVEDGSVAATMIMLQAEDLGLGSCWIQVRDRRDATAGEAEDNVRRALGIPLSMRVLCIVAVGHKGMERKPQNEDRLLWGKVHTEKW